MIKSEEQLVREIRPQTVSGRKNLTFGIGVLLLVLAVLLSPALLEWTIFPKGILVGTSRRAAAWLFCRILLGGLGIYLLVKRPRITVIHLSAFAFVALVSSVLGTMLLQFFYKPARIECGWRSFAPAAEQNEFGFRGRRIEYSPSDYVIVLLGDSQVEGMALPFDSMPERLLESELNSAGKRVKVFSLGSGGYGQDQELLALTEYLGK